MDIALTVVCVAFVFISGRNDGSPLVALPLQSLRGSIFPPILLLWMTIPIIPLLGFWQVADSLQKMAGFDPDNLLPGLIVLSSVLIILLIASLINIPTSITLALVGSLTGVTLGSGGEVDSALLVRVVLLGMCAPIIAALLSSILSAIPLRTVEKIPPRRLLSIYRGITFPALAVAYAANDGQKLMFASALLLGTNVEEAASMPWVLVTASSIFMCGVLVGLRGSARFVRHGITAITPVALLWTEGSTAITVLGGSLLGVPLSMTQSLTGALLGTGFVRSAKSVYWNSIKRIGLAWLWTLPGAALLSYLAASIFG